MSVTRIKLFQELELEIHLLANTKKFQYLFGKTKFLQRRTLIPTISEDIWATCQLCQIPQTIPSHSFRISMISRLLKVTSVQNVAGSMGHIYLQTTMFYHWYRVTKSKILKIYEQAEEGSDILIKKPNNNYESKSNYV